MMTKYLINTLTLTILTTQAFAADSVYCPQKAGFIRVGMTQAQVLAACGTPLSKQESNIPAMKKTPVQQLMYNNQGAPQTFYGVGAIPVANGFNINASFNNSNVGVQLQVDIANNQVKAIKMNGSDTNSFSICRGANIQVGDPASKVYSACGSPSMINSSFVNEPIQSKEKPQLWTYQANQYQNPISLTFVNGNLQSIN